MTTGITTNPSGFFRDTPGLADIQTLPQALSEHGYRVTGFGKLFHRGHGNVMGDDFPQRHYFGYGPKLKHQVNHTIGDGLSDWAIVPGPVPIKVRKPAARGAGSFDEDVALRVSLFLSDEHADPFFLGCGFFRPHTPLYAPKRFFDRFPLDSLALTPAPVDDSADLPYFGKRPRVAKDIEAPGLWQPQWVEDNGKRPEIVQAYLACVAYVDEQIGKVIDAVDESRYADNTYIFAVSDHGWNLGEKQHWGKAALWEQTTRIPFLVSGPGVKAGETSDIPVDLLALYPTIAELCGMQAEHRLEGRSLVSSFDGISEAEAAEHVGVVMTFSDHHALKTKEWRYIRYHPEGEELYDLSSDPHEFVNLITQRPEQAEEMRKLMDSLLESYGTGVH